MRIKPKTLLNIERSRSMQKNPSDESGSEARLAKQKQKSRKKWQRQRIDEYA